ncbi:DUF1572 family protein [Flavobacterium sp.]
MINNQYIESLKKQFLYYKTIGEKAINQIPADQLFTSANEDSNSIAVIIKHLAGNMLSRWTDFLTTDGEKEWRNRDEEFKDNFASKEQVMLLWEKGWNCLFEALNSVEPAQLATIIYIRNEEHTVLEAFNRQLAHYSYHIGQIIFYAKILKKDHWNTLSIAKNKSSCYKGTSFLSDEQGKHSTDDELK